MKREGELSRRLSLWEVIKRDLAANSPRRGLVGAAICYFFTPGFACAVQHRLVIHLMNGGMLSRLIGRMLWLHGTRRFACYISWLAEIGPGLALPHPVGIVIGEGAVIGSSATIYQHVTVGRARRDQPEYPQIGNNVTLYSGAVVAGRAMVCDHTTIGANAVVGNLEVGVGERILAARSVVVAPR